MTTIQIGSTGEDVKTLQAALRSRGFYTPPASIDGFFGATTEAAVKAFQASRGLASDGICGDQTWSAALDPTTPAAGVPIAPVPLPSSSMFPAVVEQWRSWCLRVQADKPDPFPINRSLRFMQLESGGNACATGRIDHATGHVYEAGLAQTYFETPTSIVHGITSSGLRSLCGCEGTSQHGGTCTDHARQIHTEVAIADMKQHRATARARLAKAGVNWDEGGLDFWAAVKLVHALPGLYSYLAPARATVADTFTWADYRRFVETRTLAQLEFMDRGTAHYVSAFGRVFKNVEDFARG